MDDHTIEPTDEELRGMGWAPGSYIIRCRDCPGISSEIWNCDKRAVRCRPCAVKAWEAGPQPLPASELERDLAWCALADAMLKAGLEISDRKVRAVMTQLDVLRFEIRRKR